MSVGRRFELVVITCVHVESASAYERLVFSTWSISSPWSYISVRRSRHGNSRPRRLALRQRSRRFVRDPRPMQHPFQTQRQCDDVSSRVYSTTVQPMPTWAMAALSALATAGVTTAMRHIPPVPDVYYVPVGLRHLARMAAWLHAQCTCACL